MAIQEKQDFIKELAGKHRPRRPLMLPLPRALLWFAVAFIVSAVWMHSVQVFRPGFAGQLEHHPFFLLEVSSALLISALGAYLAFTHATPGEKPARGAAMLLWALIALFIVAFCMGFTHLAPETSEVGARHACWMEVVEYGAAGLLVCIVLIRHGWVRFSWKLGWLYGLVAGLVPAALMQLACMYNPMHALIFHYLPVAVLIPVGLVAMRIIKR